VSSRSNRLVRARLVSPAKRAPRRLVWYIPPSNPDQAPSLIGLLHSLLALALPDAEGEARGFVGGTTSARERHTHTLHPTEQTAATNDLCSVDAGRTSGR
jgi:hypothetical protein